ncbi:helix-turn-helix transcriptional regulator [Methanococcoides sp. SA1]|nr:helix-turn-helix transcriptional regulator [Methanococcoides sp. SA1]
MLTNISEGNGVTSETLATTLDIEFSSVNHHIRNLIDIGLVIGKKILVFAWW